VSCDHHAVPFTVSHVVAILPLARSPLVPSALAIGTMVPDAPLFVPISDRDFTHGATGIVTFDLGVGLLVVAVFHGLLKLPLLAMVPEWFRARLTAPARAFTWRSLAWVVLSLVMGTLTHIAWDSFTHRTGPTTEAFPVLAEPLIGSLPAFKVAQYTSGVLGLLILAAWSWHWLRKAPVSPNPVPGVSPGLRTLVLAAAVLTGTLGGVLSAILREPSTPFVAFEYWVEGAAPCATLVLLAYATAQGRTVRLL
jgi:hypothetical protein